MTLINIWDELPDSEEFKHAGLNCLIRKISYIKIWAGYVILDKSHKLYGLDYDKAPLNSIEIHGGVTCSCCLFEDDGDERWYIGFDCGHLGDLLPLMSSYLQIDTHYWTMEETREETKKLAERIRDLL